MLRKAIFSLFFLTLSANAATLLFTYTRIGGGVVSGSMTGDLQPDENTFFVNSVLASYNGVPQVPLTNLDSIDAYGGYTGPQPPTVTLDGTYLDLLACVPSGCSVGFVLARNNNFAAHYGGYNASEEFGGYTLEAFGTWEAVLTPEPGTIGLVGIALLLVGRKLLRRQSANQRV